MDPLEQPEGKKLQLGQRTFERINEPSAEPDPNSSYQILGENQKREASFDLPGVEEEIRQRWRQQRMRDLKVFVSLLILMSGCLGFSARAHWNPYLVVPLLSLSTIVSVSTLWIVYFVSR